MKVVVIGGGAAGFFAAITAKEHYPKASVLIIEKSSQALSKVRISGGGRCNLTHAYESISTFCAAYPRGANSLKKIFHSFSPPQTMKWFMDRGLDLVTQEDGCVFPASQDAMSVVDLLIKNAEDLGISIQLNTKVLAIHKVEIGFKLELSTKNDFNSDKIIVTAGGSPSLSGLQWLKNLGHSIETPAPSLFTFNIPDDAVTRLMGIVIDEVVVAVNGTRLKADGPLLITHWGMSGPAVLKLSAFGARWMFEHNYQFDIRVNWVGGKNETEVAVSLDQIMKVAAFRQMANYRPFDLPQRLWDFLLAKCTISFEKRWSDLSKKQFNQLVNCFTNDTYFVKGKTTFRDEFVTCGGISLRDVDMNSMQSKIIPNLYFAGEVLDIDGITGGYNLQAAWSTGYVAGLLR